VSTTNWALPDVAQRYEAYRPTRERVLAYPLMFSELGLHAPECRFVLDYGCGTGRVAQLVVERHPVRVIAADPSPAMLDLARRIRPHPRVSYRAIGPDQAVDLPDQSVDAALTCFVFVTISAGDRIRSALAEVWRMLRPGASYAILDVNPDSVGVPFAAGRFGEPGARYAAGDPVPVRLATPEGDLELVDHYWPRADMVAMLHAAGFGCVQVQAPTLPASYAGPEAACMALEVEHPPFVVYLARR